MARFNVHVYWTRLMLAPAVVAALALASISLASAQTSGVRIAELQCNSDPELVTISNQGSSGQDLTGWTLKSDPVGSESYDLSAAGVLGPTVSIFVHSGPKAEGSFVWSLEPVLRDSDPTDFARIVDANGNTVDEVKCQAGSPIAPPTTTAPTTAPTAVRTSAPTASPAGGVPVGGGPPGTGSWDPLGLTIVAVSWVAAAVLGVRVVAQLRGSARPVGVALLKSPAPAIQASAANQGARLLYLLLLLVVAVIAAFAGTKDRH